MRTPCYATDGNIDRQKDDSYNAEKWHRWDEDLVTQFGLWMTRLMKIFFFMGAAIIVCFLAVWV